MALRPVRVFLVALLIGCAGVAAEEKPRVVTLAPHLTELAYAAGAGDTLAGAVAYSDWPEAARELPRIGDAMSFDLEAIVNLDADLALAWRGGTPRAVADRLEAVDIEVVWITTRTLDDIGDAIVRIGSRLGTPETARQAAAGFRDRLAAIDSGTDPSAGPGIFYQVSARPLFTLGGRHVITEVFERCGARNLFADLDAEAATVDREAVITRQPDLIIAGQDEDTEADDPLSVWRDSTLVTSGRTRLETVDPELLVRPTPRILEGIRYVCRQVSETAAGEP